MAKEDKITKIKCPLCDKEKPIREFYKSNSPRYKIHRERSPYCKKCLNNYIYNKKTGLVDRENFRYVLKEYLDKPFYQDVYIVSITDEKNTLGTYLRNLSIVRKAGKQTWEDGEIEDIKEEKENIDNGNDININNNKLTYNEKWRGNYNGGDLKYLENYLTKLQDDFNIITANHLDYAKKIAKASLAVDRAYEDMLNGVDGADKRYKDLQVVFDNLSKSAQFSEASRSAKDVGISGISQIVDKIESKEWIYDEEKFPQDELDHLYEQFTNIEKSL